MTCLGTGEDWGGRGWVSGVGKGGVYEGMREVDVLPAMHLRERGLGRDAVVELCDAHECRHITHNDRRWESKR